MIYLIIADSDNLKGDCHVLWQPHNLLPEGIKEFIENTKNEKKRDERLLAYSTLLYSLKKLFSVDKPYIIRNENGKPSLADSNIFISLSHCDGTAVVALSDEGEIGVDIQSQVDEKKAERLNDRFLSEIVVKQENVNIKYFSITFTEKDPVLSEISLNNDENNDFLSKWVYSESVIKSFGLKLSEISKINELSLNTVSRINIYKNFKIATTVEK